MPPDGLPVNVAGGALSAYDDANPVNETIGVVIAEVRVVVEDAVQLFPD